MIKYGLAVLGAGLLLAGCTDQFESTNSDPNNPTPGVINPGSQFLYTVSRSMLYAQQWQQSDQLTVCHYAEFAANDGLSASDYNADNRYIQGIWDLTYSALANLNDIIRNNEEVEGRELYGNLVQMAKIWRCWLMLRLTDYLGDIPYSEAGTGKGTGAPYDEQRDIYIRMFDELRTAVGAIDPAAQNVVGDYDLIYKGDVQKWVKFANALRLRMALRIADVDPAKAQSEVSAALSAGVLASSADDAKVRMGTMTNETYSRNAINYHAGSSLLHMSTAYYRITVGLGGQPWPTAAEQDANKNLTDEVITARIHPDKVDPRAPIQFEPSGIVAAVTTPELDRNWSGTNPGNTTTAINAPMVNGQHVEDYAKIGPFYYANPERPWPILKYDEVCFLKAIAVERGLMNGDARQFYEEGVRASMTEFGIPTGIIDAYLDSAEANFYGTTPKWDDRSGTCNTTMDKIITQKWIAHFVEGSWEAWADHRQYHKPTLMPFEHVSESVFSMNEADRTNNAPGAYIKRGFYPSSEQSTNKAHLQEALARMGGKDNIQHNLWWDVE